ncbi:MAG: methyltransferase domain-containing protein [Chloroflexota bacterium]
MLEIRHETDTRQAYDEIYDHEGILLRDSFYQWLIDLLAPVAERNLLDISCGQGRLVTLARRQGLRALGIDFSLEGVRKGRQETPAAGWAVGDGECLPFSDGSVDYITHIGSLEHYLHPDAGAREIARLLKPGGKACILLPNAFGLLGNIKHVLYKGEIFDDGQPLQRYATRASWEALLQRNGLHVFETVAYGEIERPRTLQDWRWLLPRPQKWMRMFLCRFIPLNLANHFVFLCTRER